ncbi:uncharacterized protein Dana_GF26264, partial [Drosophila ananassae]
MKRWCELPEDDQDDDDDSKDDPIYESREDAKNLSGKAECKQLSNNQMPASNVGCAKVSHMPNVLALLHLSRMPYPAVLASIIAAISSFMIQVPVPMFVTLCSPGFW